MQPERFLEQYGLWIGFGLGVFIAVFGLVMTVLERKLIVTRKAVVGYSGVNSTIVGGIIGVGCLYQITGSIPISAAYAAVSVILARSLRDLSFGVTM